MSINHHQEQKQTLEASKNRLELYRLEVERLRVALDEETNTRQVYGEQICDLRVALDALISEINERASMHAALEAALRARLDALLTALKDARSSLPDSPGDAWPWRKAIDVLDAAIRDAGG